MRIHEYLEIVDKKNGRKIIKCIKCGHEFCDINDNYKKHTLLWEKDHKDFPLRSPISGDSMFSKYQEFYCPGCLTLLEVDMFCPELDKDDPIVWDIELKL